MKKVILLLCAVIAITACNNDTYDYKRPTVGGTPAVNPTPPKPDPFNGAPIAVISNELTTALPLDVVTLDGSSSYDPERGELSYLWEQVSGETVELSGTDQPKVTFTIPDKDTIIVVELTVFDVKGAESAPATVTITVAANTNTMKYVLVDGEKGSDDGSRSGSLEEPVKTIARGLEIAKTRGLPTVYVMVGTYEENLLITQGVELIGSVVGIKADGGPDFDMLNRKTLFKAKDKSKDLVAIAPGGTIPVKSITIRNFTFENSTERRSIVVSRATDVHIVGNDFVPSATSGNPATCRIIDIAASSVVQIGANDFTSYGECGEYYPIFVADSGNVFIIDNNIRSFGSAKVGGISAYGPNGYILAEHNSLHIEAVQGDSYGISVFTSEAIENISLVRNYISIQNKANTKMNLAGIASTNSMQTIGLNIVNNVIVMPVSDSVDTARKVGVSLVNIPAGSSVNVLHNTLLVMGSAEVLNSVRTSTVNSKVTIAGNLMLTFGGNENNVHILLDDRCSEEICAVITNNNTNDWFYSMFRVPLNKTYSGNWTESEGAINSSSAMRPSSFDMSSGGIIESLRKGLIDDGYVSGLVTIDIDGISRKGVPDIGATEY